MVITSSSPQAATQASLKQLITPRSKALSNQEIKRYSRHLIMPEVGLIGQKRLRDAKVLCIGVGGLGSPLAMYLAAAGVGNIGLVDNDVVDFSNLQRQVLHHTLDVGRSKLQSATDKLKALNPDIHITVHPEFLRADNALSICEPYDVIADGTDNFQTRYLTNDACVLLKKPNVHASIFRFEGQASVFYPPLGPCYRCMYPEPPPPGVMPSCAEGGVLGVLPGVMGVIQATEVVKLILDIGSPLIGRLLIYDALEMSTRQLQLERDPNCPVCGNAPSISTLSDYDVLCGFDAELSAGCQEISPTDAYLLRGSLDRQLIFLDVREPHEWDICRIEGARHVPLSDLAQGLDQLPTDADYVVYCLAGARSKKAIHQMQLAGYAPGPRPSSPTCQCIDQLT